MKKNIPKRPCSSVAENRTIFTALKRSVNLILAIVFLIHPSFALDQASKDVVIPLPQLQKPNSINLDDSQLYITDGMKVLIYSLKDYRLIKKFGKSGEGPQEFRESPLGLTISLHGDYFVVHSLGRESFFKKDGTFIKEKNITSVSLSYKPFDDKYVGQKLLVDREKKKVDFAVVLYDQDFQQLVELYRFKHPFFQRQKVNPFDIKGSIFQLYKDHIYVDDSQGDILVFDKNGQKTAKIEWEKPKISVTDHIKQWILEQWKYSLLKIEYQAYKDRTQFPDYCPAIRDFKVLDDKIYLLTFVMDSGMSELVILDINGKLLKKAWVPLVEINIMAPVLCNYYTLKKDKLYRLQEDEDNEAWELVICNIQ